MNTMHHQGNLAIVAGAGTGKTYSLTERYLYYLQERGFSPLETVAVTFTRKAASELRARIRKRVREAMPDKLEVLAELEASQISTIHVLAGRICREHPNEAEVPPDFTMLDDQEGAILRSEILDGALGALDPKLFEYIPYSTMRVFLERTLCDPVSAARVLDRGSEQWEELRNRLREEARTELLESEAWQSALLTFQQFSGHPTDRREQCRLAAIELQERFVNTGDPNYLAGLIGIKLNGGIPKKWPDGGFTEVGEAITLLKDKIKKVQALINLEFSESDETLVALLPILREVFNQAKNYTDAALGAKNHLDFPMIEEGALRALSHAHVRDYYACRWRAILVDEFQDTNPVQEEIFSLLVEGGAELTVVGDPAQSIYRFRRADISVFERTCARIESGKDGRQERLTTCYRTHYQLLEVFNNLFMPLLGEDRNLKAHRSTGALLSPHLSAFIVDPEAKGLLETKRRLEADEISKRLRGFIEKALPVHDPKTKELRPIRPGDIAILFRANAPMEAFAEALEANGVPAIIATGGGNLLATREALDAMALLAFLANESNSFALAAVLRGPFFAVSDRQLQEFVSLLPAETTWWSELQDYPGFERPVAILGTLLTAREEETPSRLLQIADRLTGYSAVIANLPGHRRRIADWRGFLDLIRGMESLTRDVHLITNRLRRLVENDTRLSRPLLEAEDAVVLMTIHSAKGLEWPVVVVPDLSRGDGRDPEVLFFDPSHGLALNVQREEPVVFCYLKREADQAAAAEKRRLLYVAFTRARDHLMVSAAEVTNAMKWLTPLLEQAGVVIENVPFDLDRAGAPVPPVPTPPQQPEHILVTPFTPVPASLPVTALVEYAICPKRFYYRFLQGHPGITGNGDGDGAATRIGILTHLALEQGIRDERLLGRLAHERNTDNIREAIALACSFDEIDIYAPFRTGLEKRELDVSLDLNGLLFNGRIDLVGEDYVLDFKTGEFKPEIHGLQLWVYAKASEKPNAHIAYLKTAKIYSLSQAEFSSFEHQAKQISNDIRQHSYQANPSNENCSGCPFGTICKERASPFPLVRLPRMEAPSRHELFVVAMYS